jgi:hypothetical protein
VFHLLQGALESLKKILSLSQSFSSEVSRSQEINQGELECAISLKQVMNQAGLDKVCTIFSLRRAN